MPALVIVGAQWGDEGKGKLVDFLTSQADWVVRFQGGNNAGHTLVVDGKIFKLHLIPSGVLRENTRCAIAAGVVVDADVMRSELEGLKEAGISVKSERFVVDRDAHLIMGYHQAIDQARELQKGDAKIGTTGRGIGPAYEDRATRCGIRVAELRDLPQLKNKIRSNVDRCNLYLKHVLQSEIQVSYDDTWASIERAAELLMPFIGNVSKLIDDALHAGKRVIFEGAQGTLLDQMHGTIPYVTSSNTIAGAVTTGTGIGPKHIDYVLGVAKAYATRVGSGPFPTELNDQTGDYLVDRGHEFGTTTGRRRRCGWFDAVAMKRSVRLNGIDSLAITKLDVLSGLDKIKVCIRYHLDGKEVDDVPSLESELDRVTVDYIELDGWQEDLTAVRKWHDLPPAARLYLSTLSEILGCHISMVSVSPERESTLFPSSADFLKSFIGQS